MWCLIRTAGDGSRSNFRALPNEKQQKHVSIVPSYKPGNSGSVLVRREANNGALDQGAGFPELPLDCILLTAEQRLG